VVGPLPCRILAPPIPGDFSLDLCPSGRLVIAVLNFFSKPLPHVAPDEPNLLRWLIVSIWDAVYRGVMDVPETKACNTLPCSNRTACLLLVKFVNNFAWDALPLVTLAEVGEPK